LRRERARRRSLGVRPLCARRGAAAQHRVVAGYLPSPGFPGDRAAQRGSVRRDLDRVATRPESDDPSDSDILRAVDLRYSESDERFRAELRAWLAGALPALPPKPPLDDWPARRAWDTAWQRALFDAGYAGINWPKDVGGRGASPT